MEEKQVAPQKKKLNTVDSVRELALPLAKDLGLTLWDVVYVKEGADWYLRLFIDKEGGIHIDDCVNMTHAINPLLDEHDPIKGEYILEVSSPGINRKLVKNEHFKAFIDTPVHVKLIRPAENGEREFDGVLISVEENGDFDVAIDEETFVTFTKKECVAVTVIDEI